MIRKIFVFANMGHLDELPKSGGQTSARRVMKGLEGEGFEVVPIRRHRNEWEGRWKHKAEALLFALIDPCKIIGKMLFGSRKDSVFLHLTYAGPLVPYELFLSVLMLLMGYKRITYLKGGQVLDFYPRGSRLHKWMFKKNMDLQQLVMAEGEPTIDIIKKVSNVRTVYFPNYVFDDQIPVVPISRPQAEIGLLYFGRMAPDKNIHVILDAFELLCARHSNLHLTLIGGKGQSQAYADMIDRRITESPYSDRITRRGITPFEEISKLMQTHHFFVFPSQEKAEGHSNSLNEAMSQGLIPVVSNWHFNQSVVGSADLVVRGFEAAAYALCIEHLLQSDLQALSASMAERVRNHYAFSRVMPRIAGFLNAV